MTFTAHLTQHYQRRSPRIYDLHIHSREQSKRRSRTDVGYVTVRGISFVDTELIYWSAGFADPNATQGQESLRINSQIACFR